MRKISRNRKNRTERAPAPLLVTVSRRMELLPWELQELLQDALNKDCVDSLTKLIETNPQLPLMHCDVSDYDSSVAVNRPIHLACTTGSVECLRVLLQHEPEDGLLEDNHDGLSPLEIACVGRFIDCVKLILEQDAEKQIRAMSGEAIHKTIRPDSVELFEYLLSMLPDYIATRRSCLGLRAIHVACEKGVTECVRMLLASEPDVQVLYQDNAGRLPLHFACQAGTAECVQMLLAHSPEFQVLHQNKWKDIPIHLAVHWNKGHCLPWLLNHLPEEQVLARDGHNIIPLVDARFRLGAEYAKLLLHHRAEETLRTTGEFTAMLWKEDWFNMFVDLFVEGVLQEEHLPLVASGEPRLKLEQQIRSIRASKSARSSLGKRSREEAIASESSP